MPRTDRRGRKLHAFLMAEIVGADVTVEELRDAVGVTRARWYGTSGAENAGRVNDDSFPNPTELLNLANYFRLGHAVYVRLLVEFGWIDPGQYDARPISSPPENFGSELAGRFRE